MTPQEQVNALLAPYDPDAAATLAAALLSTTNARQLAASQLVPVLTTLILHAKDIGARPLLDVQVHGVVADMATACFTLNSSQWSPDDQFSARMKAEALVREWAGLGPKAKYATGLRMGKIIGVINPTNEIEVDDTNQCLYCNRDIHDATRLDYCSGQCESQAMGEGA